MSLLGLFSLSNADISAIARAVAAQLQPQFNRLGATMATLSEQLAAIKADLDASKADLANIKTGVTGLQGQVTSLNQTVKDLQAQLASAGLSPADQAAVNDLVTEADEVKASADSLASQFPPA